MKIVEFEVKEIFQEKGIATPGGKVVSTPEEAYQYVKDVDKEVVVKSQVHVGGRGKAGGIKFASSPEEAHAVSEQLLGSDLKGEIVKKVLIEQKAPIKNEYYLGITLNRKEKKQHLSLVPPGGWISRMSPKNTPKKLQWSISIRSLGFMTFISILSHNRSTLTKSLSLN